MNTSRSVTQYHAISHTDTAGRPVVVICCSNLMYVVVIGCVVVIRPMSCEPHIQHIKKCDPVSRYQSYRHCWTSCRAPGEKAHKHLRWGVREKMLYYDQVVDKVSLLSVCLLTASAFLSFSYVAGSCVVSF